MSGDIVEEARKEAELIITEVVKRAEQEAEQIRVKANEEAYEIKSAAEEEAKEERASALAEIPRIITRFAVTLGHHDADDIKYKLFGIASDGSLPVLEDVEELDQRNVTDPINVVTPTPLHPKDVEAVTEHITSRLTEDFKRTPIRFLTNHDLIGGILIKSRTWEYEDSIRKRLRV